MAAVSMGPRGVALAQANHCLGVGEVGTSVRSGHSYIIPTISLDYGDVRSHFLNVPAVVTLEAFGGEADCQFVV
jgi:hypothetical protein